MNIAQTSQPSSSQWQGIFPPLVTPLLDNDTLDVAGLERLLEHVLAGGVHGLFLLGTTGEAPGLSYRLRRELIERACRQVADRVPLLVGITDTSFVETVNLARFAADAGASALVVSAPYYFPMAQPELLEYVRHLAPHLPLPLFLYNMPSHTKIVFESATLRRAMDIPNIIGLKDSGGNMAAFHVALQLRKQCRPDWSLLVGPEELLGESVLMGGNGGVVGGANLFPRLYVNLYEAAASGDLEQVHALHAQIMRVVTGIYKVGQHGSSLTKGIKCALSCMGICDDFMAEPFHRFRAAERAHIARNLAELDLAPLTSNGLTNVQSAARAGLINQAPAM